MQLCWDRQPYKRPDFSELEAFFDGILETSVEQVGLLRSKNKIGVNVPEGRSS